MDREFDVVVFDATGFAGYLTAESLFARYGLAGDLRWAIVGRSDRKLADARTRLQSDTGIETTALATLVADASDLRSLRELAARTHVVCTTVGPYALYGSELVEACAAVATHYCDLIGEAHWMRRMIHRHEGSAQESGAPRSMH